MMQRAGGVNSNNHDWQLWQQHNKPLELATHDRFYEALEYIHQNPVVTGTVDLPEDYLYSSARDFYGDKKGFVVLSYMV
ncbi:hypothetical protein AB9P05_04445 [Roseivirga sp. BDSF3-8]|uniref:hypothetical protein n=1 Tax=Roseivirga sp. BDSF3-8 TaxID=3241598 RepID=UPI003531EEC7